MAPVIPPLSHLDLVQKSTGTRPLQTAIFHRLGSSERSVRSAELDPATASLAAASFKYAEASGRAHAADERLRTISEKTTLHFPLTNAPLPTEKKINATDAEFFANPEIRALKHLMGAVTLLATPIQKAEEAVAKVVCGTKVTRLMCQNLAKTVAAAIPSVVPETLEKISDHLETRGIPKEQTSAFGHSILSLSLVVPVAGAVAKTTAVARRTGIKASQFNEEALRLSTSTSKETLTQQNLQTATNMAQEMSARSVERLTVPQKMPSPQTLFKQKLMGQAEKAADEFSSMYGYYGADKYLASMKKIIEDPKFLEHPKAYVEQLIQKRGHADNFSLLNDPVLEFFKDQVNSI